LRLYEKADCRVGSTFLVVSTSAGVNDPLHLVNKASHSKGVLTVDVVPLESPRRVIRGGGGEGCDE
jgi:hypothetical protein